MRFNAPRHSFQQQTPVAEKIKATVKWFDPNKGFGFVAPDDGSPDAFLPASAVTAVGHDRLPEGSTVVVDLVQGQKGNQVSRIYDVDTATASPRPRRDDAGRPGGRMGAPARGGYGQDRGGYGNDRGGYGGGGYGQDRGGYGNDRGGYGQDRGGYGNDRGGGGGYGGGYADRSSGPAEEVEGTVKWFNTTKGFGFVAPDSGGKDVFVHITAVERSGVGALQENQRVRMKVQQGQKGLEAVSIETL
ncbi:cold-shock protein [Skermanella pratensis]|uniref:cold-shock protein n=1 Tax=Skermanella pratensis TaxID=2233999 RepID=UPI0013019AA3|nr:cold-shock protein [Skermanella pratensis]